MKFIVTTTCMCMMCGCMLQESRLTEADTQTLVSYLSSYIRETTGVLDVRDAMGSVTGKQFFFSCTVDTEYGEAEIDYSI